LFDNKEMLEKIISNVINERIDKIFGGLTGIFKKKYNEYKIKTGKAFEEYIKFSIEKYKYTKTILYKYDPVLIEDFYVNLDLELNNKIIDTRSVKNLIEINNGLIITGIAGGGKSTLMKYLFLDSIKNEIDIPIFIEIRNIKKDIFSDLFEILKKSNFPQDVGLFKKINKTGDGSLFDDPLLPLARFRVIGLSLLSLTGQNSGEFDTKTGQVKKLICSITCPVFELLFYLYSIFPHININHLTGRTQLYLHSR